MNHYGNGTYETSAFKKLDQKLRSNEGARFVTRMVPHSGIVTKIADQRQKLAAVIHDNNSQTVKQAAWDIIPAQILLEEAGGVMVNIHNEKIDPYKPELIVAAANEKIARSITQLVAK